MVGSWAAFAASLTEDDSLLLPNPEFADDDPSSYLLYPPGFGPVEDWLALPASGVDDIVMLAGEAPVAADPDGSGQKGADLVLDGGREGDIVDGSGYKSGLEVADCGVVSEEGRCSDGSGALELLGLSEALSGMVSLVGCSDCGTVPAFSCADDCAEKDGVDEFMVIGNSEEDVGGGPGVCKRVDSDIDVSRASGASFGGEGGGSVVCGEVVNLKEDVNGAREAPPATTEVKVEDCDNEVINLRIGESSESDSDDSSSSSSSSSSSEESSEEGEEGGDDEDSDKDDVHEDERHGGKREKMDEKVDFEEGEIRDLDAEEVAMSSDDDDDVNSAKGPIRSKNELERLPPVPPVKATLEPHHQTLPVGVISSIIGTKVIVEGLEKHNPLNEGSILWITETRSPLGLVDEIFGPVKNPYYVIRFNSEKEILAGIREGTSVSFVSQFANHILNEPVLYKRGYDASGDNDEEVSDEEFSDDEKEAEHKRSLRQTKRGTENRNRRDQESIGKKRAQFGKRRFETKTTGFRNRKDVQALTPSPLAPISQPLNVPGQLRSVVQQPWGPSGLARINQPLNVRSQLQSTVWQPSVYGVSAPISQPTNAPNQLRATLQKPFIPGQTQVPPRPTCVPGQVQAPPQPLVVPVQMQAPAQPPCVPGQVQASHQPPIIPGQPQAATQQPCVPGQLQALLASLQQPCAPGQVQAPTLPPHVLGTFQAPSSWPCAPGSLQAQPVISNVGCGDFTGTSLVGDACLSGPSTVPAIPSGGQSGGPFRVTQQNSLVPQSNAVWAHGLSAQQLITGLLSMLQNNGMPSQQPQEHPGFYQNQNQHFLNFSSGMPFQHQFTPNQAMPPTISWQGGAPNPSVGPPSLDPVRQDALGQAQSRHTGTGEQRSFGLSNADQNFGQSQTTIAQDDMHASMRFSTGSSSVRGRKPYGRGGG
uniref:H/ACA ribonucleoprotein complex non-core subunit NAF1 n=1 Tax=Anthurium amnicola TaxID=1678845 RepID=A0A1D1XIG8_9ARAE